MICEIPHTSESVGGFWQNIMEIVKSENKILDDTRAILERYALDLVNQGLCGFCIPIL